MKASLKADYALHAMLYVAGVNGHHASSINEIAEAENIPREYLAKILKLLAQVGLLKSTRGVHGGYFLAKPRKDYTFLEILEAMDGPVDPTSCTKPEAERSGHRKGRCAAYPVFDEIKKKLRKDLSAINLGTIPYGKYYPALRSDEKQKP